MKDIACIKKSAQLESWLKKIMPLQAQSISVIRKPASLLPMQRMLKRLNIPLDHTPIISIVGTNGKGSCVEIMQQLLLASGKKTASFTSPHLFQFNERIRINGSPATDQAIMAAFEKIEALRGDILLTFFEYALLAAWIIFYQHKQASCLDFIILEAGIGARLDATNCLAGQYAIISSIGLDHCELLGYSLKQIASEKCAIMRPGQHTIYAPGYAQAKKLGILAHAQQSACQLYCKDRDYTIKEHPANWEIHSLQSYIIPKNNSKHPPEIIAACAMLADLLGINQQLTNSARISALHKADLPGRCQIIDSTSYRLVIDVAHNPPACQRLVAFTQKHTGNYALPASNHNIPPTVDVTPTYTTYVGLLEKKDCRSIIDVLAHIPGAIVLVAMNTERSCSIEQLQHLQQLNNRISAVISEDAFCNKLQQLLLESNTTETAAPNKEHVIVCGSFYLAALTLKIAAHHTSSKLL